MRRFCEKIKRLQYIKLILMMTVLLFMTGAKQASAAGKLQTSYQIKVNRVHNTVTIYEKDKTGKYTVPVKAMACSVGLNGQTRAGTFQTKEKYRWKALMGDVWGQYSTRIVGGILFHSVYYYEYGNPASLATKQFNKLGTAASHGCIRLTVADAKWIYDNCSVGTTVVIYDDKKNPGPLGKPEVIKIPSKMKWDPTDPSPENPYSNTKPNISGAKNIKMESGETVDLLKGITAKSSLGTDITSAIKVKSKVDTSLPGKYEVVYSVTDLLGRTAKKAITVTVVKKKEPPVLTGVSDRVVGGGITINRKFALSGVEAFAGKQKLDNKLISVNIKKVAEKNSENEEYHITYAVKFNGAECKESAVFYIDREAPKLYGVAERILEAGQIPDREMALEEVSVFDNYTQMGDDDISVTISEMPDGNYQILYEVVDEAGNSVAAQTIFRYDTVAEDEETEDENTEDENTEDEDTGASQMSQKN